MNLKIYLYQILILATDLLSKGSSILGNLLVFSFSLDTRRFLNFLKNTRMTSFYWNSQRASLHFREVYEIFSCSFRNINTSSGLLKIFFYYYLNKIGKILKISHVLSLLRISWGFCCLFLKSLAKIHVGNSSRNVLRKY